MRAALVAVAALSVAACGEPKEKVPGNGLAGPTAVRAIPGGNQFLVLSSGAFGDYSKGSLQQFDLAGGGASLALRSAIEIPTLGTTLGVSGDGLLAAVGFVGEKSHIEIFSRTAGGTFAKAFDIAIRKAQTLSTLRFFTFEGRTFLTAALEGRTSKARTLVWELQGNVATTVLQLPEDLGASYVLSHASPVFLPEDGLLVVFPSFSSYPDGLHADPIAFQKGERASPREDPRAVSALAIDMARLLAPGGRLASSYVSVPLIYDPFGFSGDLSLAAHRPENLGVTYHNSIEEAFHPGSPACQASFAGSLLVSELGGVFRLSGWNKLKSNFQAAFAGTDPTQKVALGVLNASLYSSASANAALSSFGTRFVSFAEDTGATQCLPAWTRMEVRSSSQSNARSWLLWNEGISPHTPKSQLFPSRGISDAIIYDGKVLGASYSHDRVDVLSLAP